MMKKHVDTTDMGNSITNENSVLVTNGNELQHQSISPNITIETARKKKTHVERVSGALRKQKSSNLLVIARNSYTIKEMWNEHQH